MIAAANSLVVALGISPFAGVVSPKMGRNSMSRPDELANFFVFWMSNEVDNVTGQSVEYSRYHARRVRGLKAL